MAVSLITRCCDVTNRYSCIIGYGALGKNIEKIGTALGMKVLVTERKGASQARPGRVMFEDALKLGTIFMIVTPLDDSTRGMIGAAELSTMNKTAFLINVGRGGVVNEAALASALREHKIAGAGVDVFEHEPAGKSDSPLIDTTIPNLILTPHIAWYSTATIAGTLKMIKANLDAFAAGKPQNLVEI